MKIRLAAAALTFSSSLAFAQMADPVADISQEWTGYQLEQTHLLKSMMTLIQAYQALKTDEAAKDKYWADYVAGLTPPPAK